MSDTMFTSINGCRTLPTAVVRAFFCALLTGTRFREYTLYKDLITTLEVVRAKAVAGEIGERGAGLCYAWDQELNRCDTKEIASAYAIVPVLALGMPGHSGGWVSPIPLLDGSARYSNPWEGVYLERRLALIDHILKQLKAAGGEL